jgi:hypothetical protein
MTDESVDVVGCAASNFAGAAKFHASNRKKPQYTSASIWDVGDG